MVDAYIAKTHIDPGSKPPDYGEHASDTIPRPEAGAQYPPGTYPTPDLFTSPAARYRVLDKTRSYTSIAIQSALDSLGEYGTLYLPQGSCWAVSNPIVLKPYQELATWGYPTTESNMALLKAESTCKAHILLCHDVKGILLRNLKIDGGRETFGPGETNGSLVRLGGENAEGQVLDRCIIKHPRNWVCIHVYKGGKGIRVTNNLIGPAGYDPDSDLGEKRASGLNYCGRSGLVAGNQFLDVSSDAIGLHPSPGTVVTSNTIITRHCAGLVGIDMTSFEPDEGNYGWTQVTYNTISIQGSYLRIGIAQGWHVSWARHPKPNKYSLVGGVVSHNLIESKLVDGQSPGAMGFGFAVSQVENWACTDNISATNLIFQGVYSESELRSGETLDKPAPFIKSRDLEQTGDVSETSNRQNKFQPEFDQGTARHLVRIKPVG